MSEAASDPKTTPRRHGQELESSSLVARIHVFPRREILDPQGKALGAALGRLGFDEVEDVRAGKSFDLVLRSVTREEAAVRVEEMCRRLLANPVIEDYSFELAPEGDAGEETG